MEGPWKAHGSVEGFGLVIRGFRGLCVVHPWAWVHGLDVWDSSGWMAAVGWFGLVGGELVEERVVMSLGILTRLAREGSGATIRLHGPTMTCPGFTSEE